MADVLEVLASALRAGLTPSASVALAQRVAEEGTPLERALGHVHVACAAGTPAGMVWRAHVDAVPQLALLAGAWTLTEDLGAPLAPAVDAAVDSIRARDRLLGMERAQTSGARTSMVIISVLPLTGPLFALALGADASQVYLASPVGLACLAVGILLAAAGWMWSRSILRRAVRSTRVS